MRETLFTCHPLFWYYRGALTSRQTNTLEMEHLLEMVRPAFTKGQCMNSMCHVTHTINTIYTQRLIQPCSGNTDDGQVITQLGCYWVEIEVDRAFWYLSCRIHRAALWILGEYCTTAEEIQSLMNEIRNSLGEIPIVEDEMRKAAGEDTEGIQHNIQCFMNVALEKSDKQRLENGSIS